MKFAIHIVLIKKMFMKMNVCEDDHEDEHHFLFDCPVYSHNRAFMPPCSHTLEDPFIQLLLSSKLAIPVC